VLFGDGGLCHREWQRKVVNNMLEKKTIQIKEQVVLKFHIFGSSLSYCLSKNTFFDADIFET